MAQVKTYDPTKVIVTFGGFIISGFGEGSMIKADRKEDAYKVTVGAQGDVVRSKSANHTGDVTIALLETSASNGIFSTFMLADENTDTGIVPLLIKDLNGTALVSASEAWISKAPSLDFDKGQKDRAWKIECSDLVIYDAGY